MYGAYIIILPAHDFLSSTFSFECLVGFQEGNFRRFIFRPGRWPTVR